MLLALQLLILGVFVAHIAHKTTLFIVPALEMAASEFQQRLGGVCIPIHRLDVLSSNVANGFVADTTSISII